MISDSLTAEAVQSFLSSVVREKPLFEPTPVLGVATINIFAKYGQSEGVALLMDQVLELKGIKESLRLGFYCYVLHKSGKESTLMLKQRIQTISEDQAAELTSVNASILQKLLDQAQTQVINHQY